MKNTRWPLTLCLWRWCLDSISINLRSYCRSPSNNTNLYLFFCVLGKSIHLSAFLVTNCTFLVIQRFFAMVKSSILVFWAVVSIFFCKLSLSSKSRSHGPSNNIQGTLQTARWTSAPPPGCEGANRTAELTKVMKWVKVNHSRQFKAV